ncbi:MAG: phenylacetate--CoA ligase family protein [Solirubrobacterales bacterium]|nr:phenylacetate--CoA ligase family protein [Solirubrobacterales bacterium]
MIAGKSFYDKLPLWTQTLAVNLVSADNFRGKYGPIFHRALSRLADNERKSKDQLLEEQNHQLHSILKYAHTHVPYYRRLGLSPDNFQEWPILDKQLVASRPDDFVSDEFRHEELMTLKTSGTTGTPLQVRVSKIYHQMEMAFRWRHRAWGGVPYLSRAAYVSGHAVVPAAQLRGPFWRVGHVEKRLLCSACHLSPGNLPGYIDALRRYAADFVHGYPSSLYVLAQFMLEHDVHEVRPRAVFTASETLLDFQRATIQKAFGAKVFNWYGNTEMACNIVECEASSLHYRTDYGLLEILEDGAMVCTGLNNCAMPLIRYRVGDVAVKREGLCACGRAFPLVERVEGRIEDYVVTPEGRRIGRLDQVFKDTQHIREAQLVQKQVDELIIRIVKIEGFSSEDERVILAEARRLLGDSIQIRFDYVNHIPRTSGGKFRFIASSLSQTTAHDSLCDPASSYSSRR